MIAPTREAKTGAAPRASGIPYPSEPEKLLTRPLPRFNLESAKPPRTIKRDSAPMVEYALVKTLHAPSAFIAISAEEYAALSSSGTNLRRMLAIEEQLDLVLGNYLDLENDLLSVATRHMLFVTLEYELFQRDRNLVANRRLLNLLSACRGYLDHAPYNLNRISDLGGTPMSVVATFFGESASLEYDRCLGYRVMEALRNYTQHARFPISVRYSSGWTETPDEEDSRLVTTVAVLLNPKGIGRDFKASVRTELQKRPEPVDIRLMIRQYVASIGKIHEQIREKMHENVRGWEAQIYDALKKLSIEHPYEGIKTAWAVQRDEDEDDVARNLYIY